jgi:hydrogenase maturation protease
MTVDPSSGRGLPGEVGSAQPKTLIVGLGNPILGDDGVGWCIAECVEQRLQEEPIEASDLEVDCLALGGLSLMERLVGYQRAIIIDAITTHQSTPGTVSCFPLEALPNLAAGHTTAAHDTSLKTAMDVGRSMGAQLPKTITIVTVETERGYNFSEELSAAVAAAVTPAVQIVIDIIRQGGPQ